LQLRFHAAKTRDEFNLWREARNFHHKEIQEFRRYYHADQLKSRNTAEFLCIGIDGADSSTTYCPQFWMSHLRKDMQAGSYVEQKVMSVVLHGTPDQIFFYINTPQVQAGMNLTTNCLLEVLARDADLRATSLRLQYDGKFRSIALVFTNHSGSSENVNYAMHCLCGLLVYLGIFEHVFANRFPVG
jgi:hypothetical protein